MSPENIARLIDATVPAAWLLAGLLAFVDAWIVTRLVRLEYMDYKTHWEADGEPHGFFWVPSKWGLWVSHRHHRALIRVSWLWIFKTPYWMKNDPTATRLVVWHRCLVPTFCICIYGPFVLLLLEVL
jgi:hypothetical protein